MSDEIQKPRLLHVEGRNLIEIELKENVELLDGDVYVFDEGNNLWIWCGKDCSVDEKTVAAWLTNKIDKEERRGVPEVYTIHQDEEPEEFKQKFSFKVIDGDTPGFLRKTELDMVEYKLFHIFTRTETLNFDEAHIEEVEISKDNLKTGDVYVLDGNEVIFCWIGAGANIEERRAGQKLMQTIDAERHYLPLQYTIYENENSKSEKGFYEFLEKAANAKGPVVSVEDYRELLYKPEKTKTIDEHKETVDEDFEATKIEATKIDKSTKIEATKIDKSTKIDKTDKKQQTGKFDLMKAIRGLPSDASFERKDDNGDPLEETLVKPSQRFKKPDYEERLLKPSQVIGKINRSIREERGSNISTLDTPNYTKCVAKDMHQYIFAHDKPCSVCNITPKDCIANEMHQYVFEVNKSCSVCGAVK